MNEFFKSHDIKFWVDVFNILASIATFLAFLVLFRRDKSKEDQLVRLTGIAGELAKQNKVLQDQNKLLATQIRNSMKPILILGSYSYLENLQKFIFKLHNHGMPAYIEKLKAIKDTFVKFQEEDHKVPLYVSKGNEFELRFRLINDVNLSQAELQFEIYFADINWNRYRATIEGQGQTFKMTVIDLN